MVRTNSSARRLRWLIAGAALLGMPAVLLVTSDAQHTHQGGQQTKPKQTSAARAPEILPSIPQPEAVAAQVPLGYRVEVVVAGLTYPTSVEFDDAGNMYVAEGGYIYGDDVAPARVLCLSPAGETKTVADNLNGPITDLLWHDKRLYISHRGKISVLEASCVRDLVTGLPSAGDHHNNQMAIGPDGKLYVGQGAATNSGVVGLDSFKMGWLAQYPDVHDVPAKDIRVTDQSFETPDPLAMFAEKGQDQKGHDEHGTKEEAKSAAQSHEGHGAGAKGSSEGKKSAPAEAGHEDHSAKGGTSSKGQADHSGHGSTPKDAKQEHAQHATPGTDKQTGHAGHGATTKGAETSHEGHQAKEQQPQPSEHAGHGSAADASKQNHGRVKTYAFQPFGRTPPDDGAIRGATKANGTILRMNVDGSDLEVYAWGLRNPFGVFWGPDDELYVSDNGYDERGSRPIAHAPDFVWRIKQGAWYGFPDYAGGVPVTDARFEPENGPAPKFLMRDHPMAETPLVTLKHHVAAA